MREHLRDVPLAGEWHVVAIGKAAGAMALGALDMLGPRLRDGCVIAPVGHAPPELLAAGCELRVIYGSHPVPDASSLVAGDEVVRYVRALPPGAPLLFLISGGASSLVEWPVPGIELEDLQRLNRWALGSGAPIATVNAARRRLSQLKGGGLAALAGRRAALALMISDVPGDDPRTIGSGLLHAPGNFGSASLAALPPEIAELVARADAGRPPVGRVPRVPVKMVASLRMACLAAAAAAQNYGLRARIGRSRFAGDAGMLGEKFAASLGRLPRQTVMIHGGESTVSLPPQPGRGGRNQHLALAAAMTLEARQRTDCWLLAAGTDGIDGITNDAGALVDARTCARGRDAGCDPRASLAWADSGTFLEASGDLLHTGPTLTNVGDIILGLHWRGDR